MIKLKHDAVFTSKTRSEIATEYGVSRRTFYNWLKRENISLDRSILTPKEILMVYKTFGRPPINKKTN